jgi:hypothetical protein
MRCVVSAEADDAEAMRASVVSAVPLSVEHVAVSEAEASLMASITSPMAPAKSAIAESIKLRRANTACSAACRCRVMALATSKLMACDTLLACAANRAAEKRCLRARASNAALST